MGYLYHTFSSQGSSITEEVEGGETEEVDEYKETVFSGHHKMAARVNPQWLWLHTQDPCKPRLDKVPVRRGKVGMKPQPSWRSIGYW